MRQVGLGQVVDYLNQHLTLFENAMANEAWQSLDLFDGVTEGNVTRLALAAVEAGKTGQTVELTPALA